MMISVLVALCLAVSPELETGPERQARLIRHELDYLRAAITEADARAQLLTPAENVELTKLDTDLKRFTPKWIAPTLIAGSVVLTASLITGFVFGFVEAASHLFCFDGCSGYSVFGVGGWLTLGLVAAGALISLIVALVEDQRFRKLAAPVRDERELLLQRIATRRAQPPQPLSEPVVIPL